MDLAIGWLDCISATAASSNNFSSVTRSSYTSILLNLNSPLVNVPVLSNTTVCMCARDSKYSAPLTSMPCLLAEPIPPKKPSGTDTTSAHGQETTRKISALYTQSWKLDPGITRGGMTAKSSASAITRGV